MASTPKQVYGTQAAVSIYSKPPISNGSKYNTRLPAAARTMSCQPHSHYASRAELSDATKITAPETQFFTQKKVVPNQPDYLLDRVNYMKAKNSYSNIPDFAVRPEHPGPRESPYKSNNFYVN
jgi:hypothetical protein